MGSSVFSIGVSGLNAANMGLTTTGHNIANVNTPGYSRQLIKQSAPYPQLSGSGFVGMGVQVDSVARVYDQFLSKQVQTTQAKASYQAALYTHLKDIDNIVADPTAGISPALQDYFKAVQNVATNPSDTPSRQALLSSAQTLVNRFQTFEQRLSEQRSALNGEIGNAVADINAYARQVADINKQIVLATGQGQPPNDLLDQRDQLIKDLNQYVKATTIAQSDGSINVFIGTGQNLVVGGETFELAAQPSKNDPQRTTVVYMQNNREVYIPEDALDGGLLGGLLAFRTDALDAAQNSLARVGLGLVESFNDMHRAGMDLNGKLGQNLFDFARSNGSSNDAPNMDLLTFSLNSPTASDNIALRASSATNVPVSDFSLAFDGTNYTLTRLSDQTTQTFSAADLAAGYSALGVTVELIGGAPTAAGTIGMSFPPAISYIAANENNGGDAALAGYIADISKLTDSNYDVTYDGANLVVTRLSDNTKTAYSLAQATTDGIEVDGLFLKLDNTGATAIQAGDSFSVQPYKSLISGLSVRITDPREIAAASPIRLTTGAANTGSVKMSQPLVDKPSTVTSEAAINPALRNPVNIAFTSASDFTVTDTVTGAVTNHTYTAGMTLNVNGWSTQINGTPAAGDTFSVGANIAGSEDGRNALALAGLQTTRILNGGTATFQESYGQMVAQIGIQTNEAKIMSEAQVQMLTQAETARDSVSAVNLDEEAANLLRYQQAYMAASKLIQIAQQAFEEIVNLGR